MKTWTYMDEELVTNHDDDGHNAHLAQDKHKCSDRVNGRHTEHIAHHQRKSTSGGPAEVVTKNGCKAREICYRYVKGLDFSIEVLRTRSPFYQNGLTL